MLGCACSAAVTASENPIAIDRQRPAGRQLVLVGHRA